MWGTVKSRGAFIIAAAIVMTVSTLETSSAAGATVKVTGAGTVQCTAVGRVHAAPPLTTTPNANTHLVIAAKLTCSQGTTGNPAVTVTTGKFSGKTAPFSAGCQSTAFGPGSAKVMWKATGGKVDKSVLTWSTATATDGPNVILDLTGPGAPGSGSYAGADFHVHLVGNAVTGGLCGGAKRGFAFTGSGGTSTLDIATPNPNNLPIKHVVVLMQENRSADNYLAQLSTQGQPNYEAEPTTGNPDPTNPLGPPIVPFHKTTYCEVADLNHSWNGTHAEYNGGAMDGFTAANVNALDPNGSRTMGYYDQTDLPYYYGLYSTFATGDRYFASTLTQTFPNRLYLLAGTSFGHIRNDASGLTGQSIFNLLDARSITWRIYASQFPISYGVLFFKYVNDHKAGHVFPMSQYFTDLANNTLPDVTFIDPKLTDSATVENDEHPPSNVQVGQKFVADVVNGLMTSPEWSSSALFLSYDEHGGFYDHVVPPTAPIPDGIPPMLQPGDTPGAFDRYGIRVPAVVISPYSKASFVSHVTHDHTSILRFIEYRFGLPSLTNRDAAADPMLEMFDFNNPPFTTPPSLPTAVIDPVQLAACP